MERVAERNNAEWNKERRSEGSPELSVDEEFTRILNDNTYDYRGYYNKYPNGKGNAIDHWTDEFKTMYHPTFSVYSKYSGKKSQYNPEGVLGGRWDGERYIPAWGQKLPKYGGGKKAVAFRRELGVPYDNSSTDSKRRYDYKYVQAGKDNGWERITDDEMSDVFQDLVVRPKSRGGNTDTYNWKKQWAPKSEPGLEIVSPEFEVLSGIRGVMSMLSPKHPKSLAFDKAIKLSDSQWDNLYFSAIKRGNMSKAQKLRDLHFKVKTPNNRAVDAIGNPKKQYHTVGDEYDPSFNEFKKDMEGFDSNVYTTDNKFMSGTYSSRLLSSDEVDHIIESTRKMNLSSLKMYRNPDDFIKKQISIYSDPKKARKQILKNHEWLNGPIESNRQKQLYSYLKNPVEIDAEGRDWAHIPLNNLPEDVFKNIRVDLRGGIGNWYSTRSVENAIRELDYDGAIVKRVLDYGGRKQYFGPEIMNSPGTVFSIKNPKNIKLADAITYDDAGKIIPLSKRDNFNIKDIRYALPWGLFGAGYYNKYAE